MYVMKSKGPRINSWVLSTAVAARQFTSAYVDLIVTAFC